MTSHSATGSADYYWSEPPALRPGQTHFQGTNYDRAPYTGPMNLTDARPWADEAACKNVPHIFEAADGAKPRKTQVWVQGSKDTKPYLVNRPLGPIETAKAVCAGCPARAACLTEAMNEEEGDHQHRYSVRGGLTPAERGDLWKNLRKM